MQGLTAIGESCEKISFEHAAMLLQQPDTVKTLLLGED
jgi:hypothetical protein